MNQTLKIPKIKTIVFIEVVVNFKREVTSCIRKETRDQINIYM